MRQATSDKLSRFRNSVRSTIALALATAIVVAAAPATAAPSKAAAIVIDANTGKTLYSSNAEAPRFPASLTKMMTLYMVFEAMAAGRITKNTQVPFSAHASSRPPTKLGVRPGGSVTVETVILALVTKSANDAAAAVGELLGGSEEGFARMMTAKARKLGMKSTTFRNASGLPDPAQKTTARDMAILGMSLRAHFPRDYAYFSTRSFAFGKQQMGNHNKLLGRVKGVDGIKTGYTRASGFNLVSSVKDGDRKIVAVVMGGNSGGSRDARMAELIQAYLPKASSRSGGNPLIAARTIEAQEPIVASVAPAEEKVAIVPVPAARPKAAKRADVELAFAKPEPRPAATVEQAEGEGDIDPVSTASILSGWVIQVGSVGSEAEARALLSKTAAKADTLLADASPFTEPFAKGGTTYIRARFAGFPSQAAATKTCAALKTRDIACYAAQK
ncbi:MAG: D-alanyl-D-alanine carboxypeptidase family protein [Mesorhizobium sp.]|nr:D-alanyl-D-alanine carboxypeptidase family protein [Mesorhizobium sp.]